MKYSNFSEDDFVSDSYFQKWILNPDQSTNDFWTKWTYKNPEKKDIIASAASFIRLLNTQDSNELSKNEFDEMWKVINLERKNSGKKDSIIRKNRSKSFNFFLKVAAIFIGVMVISIAGYRFMRTDSSKDIPSIVDGEIILKLEDGTVQIINDNVTEIIKNSDGEKVVSQKENTLIYEGEITKGRSKISYNELEVPYGKKFKLKLSDGTQVVLNSGSKLRYPVVFLAGKSRDVYLEGEAYFSVEKFNNQTFNVITNQMNTRVYGTKFNVSSYENENNTSTVLLEGSVGVYKTKDADDSEIVKIEPGYRANLENDAITIDKVNVAKYIAWTNHELLFIDDEFEVIIKELERHFNLNIINNIERINKKRYTGTFTTETINQILDVFQEHTEFDYSVNGNSILISEKVTK
ncbi:DUF4974 domain-containing protein [Kriegella sp. EG-1]|nr:DUF4974 domain-containing protein [Flavobacteriaceae bacterium EG-1]